MKFHRKSLLLFLKIRTNYAFFEIIRANYCVETVLMIIAVDLEMYELTTASIFVLILSTLSTAFFFNIFMVSKTPFLVIGSKNIEFFSGISFMGKIKFLSTLLKKTGLGD